MCIREHSICNAGCDYQGKLGQAVLAASPALQLALDGWASAAATDVIDVLGRRATFETGTLNVETCTFTLPGFGTNSGTVIAKRDYAAAFLQ